MLWVVALLVNHTRTAVHREMEFVVPGAYLVRCNDMSSQDLMDELRYAGLVFARRFLPHVPRSDYLVLFNPSILRQHAQVDEGSWADQAKKQETTVVKEIQPQVVEAKKPVARKVQLSKGRPGRHAREMLKALQQASVDLVPEAPKVEDPLPKEIQPDSLLLLRGSGISHPMFKLRPFRVDSKLDFSESATPLGLTTVPHLVVYNPPRPETTKPLDHVEKSQSWIKQLIRHMITCGLLPDETACRVLNSQLDASRLSKSNLISMQCRFREDISIPVRIAVYSILRSSPWFEEEKQYLVRCWWRQVPVSVDDS